jgi:hypothetical protein
VSQLFFRPFGACFIFLHLIPRLALWAVFLHRFAAAELKPELFACLNAALKRRSFKVAQAALLLRCWYSHPSKIAKGGAP